MKRYVLRVLSGRERDVYAALERRGYALRLPVENRMIRSGGQWKEREYLLMPGYLFIDLEKCNAATHVRLLRTKYVSRVLCDGKGEPVPLTADESAWIDVLCAALVEPSTVQLLPDGDYRVTGGALEQLTDRIVSLDRHARRAVVNIQVAGQPVLVNFSVYIEPLNSCSGTSG